MKQIAPYILFFLLLISCGGSHQAELSEVDSLLVADNFKEAELKWEQIDTSRLGIDERKQYQLQGEEIRSSLHVSSHQTTLARMLVDYFLRRDNQALLTRAYLQLAIRQLEADSAQSAISSLKQAEHLSNSTQDSKMRMRVMYYLAKVNAMSSNFGMAIKYATTLQQEALRRRDRSNQALCYNMLACIYDMENKTDSAFYFMQKLERYTDCGTPFFRAYYLTNLGIFYMRKHQDDKALSFLERSIRIQPLADTYCALAVISARRGDMAKADSLWHKSLSTDNLYYKITFMQTMFAQYCDIGKYREAAEISQQLLPMKDTLTMRQQTAQIQELQQKFDQQIIHHKMLRNLAIAVFVIFLLIVTGICYVLYMRNRQQKAREMISNCQSLIDNYTRQIEDLHQDGKTAQQKVADLQSRIHVLQKKQTSILANGRELYQKILDGGKAILWTKEDFSNFIEYYKVINLPFVQSLETEYDRLSSTHKFFMILTDMGKDDEEIQRILGMSYGAFRTAKYRIRKRALNK